MKKGAFMQQPCYGNEFKYYTEKINNIGLFSKNDYNTNDTLDFLFVGDSFTQGIGAPPDSSMPELFSICSNTKVQNAGFAGSDPESLYPIIKKLFVKDHIKVNYVIMVINRSDISDIELRAIQKSSNLYHIIKYSCFFTFVWKLIVTGDWVMIFNKKNSHNLSINRLKTILFEMNNEVQKHKSKLIVCFHPTIDEYQNSYWHFDRLISKLEAENIEVINVMKSFNNLAIDRYEIESYYWKLDGHFNSKGYKLFADIICERIKPILNKPYVAK